MLETRALPLNCLTSCPLSCCCSPFPVAANESDDDNDSTAACVEEGKKKNVVGVRFILLWGVL